MRYKLESYHIVNFQGLQAFVTFKSILISLDLINILYMALKALKGLL